MAKTISLSILFLAFAMYGSTQSNLQADTAYFRQQATAYQQWLSDSGLGNALRVHSVQTRPKALNLFLGFHTEDAELCHAIWEQLQKDFVARKGLSLEQTLYYKMIQLMETPQELSRILIYDTYDRSKKYNFEVKIRFDSAQVKVEELGWKSETRHIIIRPHQLSKLKRSSNLSWQATYSKERVFTAIQKYIKNRYTQRKCEQRYPTVEVLENEVVLRMKANDLCKEVLSTERNCMVCPLLNLNLIKRERLTFTFTYAKEASGFILSLEVDGQYGSGFYNEVGRAGYKPMDTAFKADLEDYADKLRLEIRQVLLNLNKP
jgi:hypothetical protein